MKQNDWRKEGQFMKEEGWVQCARCGHLHKATIHNLSDEDLYIESVHCGRCRDETKHLWIGPNKEDIYLYGDITLDERYFIY